MGKKNFADVLDAASNLSLDDQEELVEILHSRNLDERRSELANDIKTARSDYKNGKCKSTSVEDIMKEIL
jgi:hypothetical protein